MEPQNSPAREVQPMDENRSDKNPELRADDVRALMSEIQLRVEQAHGITLHFETHLVGFDHGD